MNHSTHMCVYWKNIYDHPPRTPRTYHVLICIHIIVLKLYLFISMIISFWSPQDLIHLFMVFTICNARFPWPNFTTVLVVPSNCKYFKTVRITVNLYMNFSKPVRNHKDCFFYYVFTTPKQEQCVNMKPIVLHIAFVWISLFLYCSFRKSPVFKERPLFLYVSPELF